MNIDYEENNGVHCFKVRGEMTVYTVREQKNSFFQHMQNGGRCRVDLSEVFEIDSAGLQLLLLLKEEAAKRGIELHFIQHSQAVIEVLELLKLTAYFGDPVVIPAGWKVHE